MGQTLQHLQVAQRVAGYYHQARSCHRVIRLLVAGAVEVATPGDGTITVRVPAAAWQQLRDDAALPPPEPIDTRLLDTSLLEDQP